jgi:hypothetical protein
VLYNVVLSAASKVQNKLFVTVKLPDAESPSHGIVVAMSTSSYQVEQTGDIHASYALPKTILDIVKRNRLSVS